MLGICEPGKKRNGKSSAEKEKKNVGVLRIFLPRKTGKRLYTQLEFANDFTGFLPPSDEERESSSPFCTPYEHDVSMFAKLIAMKRASEDDKAD